MNVASMMTGMDSANSASTKETIENDVAQVESFGDDIASLCRRQCATRREVGSSERGSTSEAELVDVWWTRWSVPSLNE